MRTKSLNALLAASSARLGLAVVLALLASEGTADTPLAVRSVTTPKDAPSVVLCRRQLFAASNDSAIMRIDRQQMRVLEVREYPGLGSLHQITTDGRMLYAAYFTAPEDGPPTFGIIEVDPVKLSIHRKLALEPYGVEGFPEGFVWHDGYLYVCAFGIKRDASASIAKIEPHSMTFVGAVKLPKNIDAHGINYDGSHLYALGVPLFGGSGSTDRYYRIDLDTLKIEKTLRMPQGIYRYGGNVYLPRNGFLYTSPENGPPAEKRGGALVKIDPASFTIQSMLPGAGVHWLATEGRYVYLVADQSVRVVDPDAMVVVAESATDLPLSGTFLHYGYVAGDGNLYLGFESHEHGRGQVIRMATFGPRDPNPPEAPPDLTARSVNAEVTLNWTTRQTSQSPILEYRVYRRASGGKNEYLTSLPAAASRYTDRGAKAGESYVYQVTAVNSSGLLGHRASVAVQNAASSFAVGQDVEITIPSPDLPGEAWARAVFTSPSGAKFTALASYGGPGIWKVHFTPRESGPWRYAVSSSDPQMALFGGFVCLASTSH